MRTECKIAIDGECFVQIIANMIYITKGKRILITQINWGGIAQ